MMLFKVPGANNTQMIGVVALGVWRIAYICGIAAVGNQSVSGASGIRSNS